MFIISVNLSSLFNNFSTPTAIRILDLSETYSINSFFDLKGYIFFLFPVGKVNAQERSSDPGILKYVRVYSDSIGETHFEDLKIKLNEIDFAPPAPPIYTSDLISSINYGFLSVLPGWESEWHPTPKRQFIIYLSGIIEAEVSDGEIRQFGPGSITLVEDTSGDNFWKGHNSYALGNDFIVLVVLDLE